MSDSSSTTDLRNRIIFTIFILAVYRFGTFVPLPGIDPEQLKIMMEGNQKGLLGMFNVFAGGAVSRMAIFALGIMPYISASIVIQLMGIAVPYFQKLQREGESGRRKINNITRYLTILITGFQAPGFISNLKSQWLNKPIELADGTIGYVFVNNEATFFFSIMSIIVLVTGTMFVMWLGEKITDRGIGNGISIIIMIGIIAALPGSLFAEFATSLESQGGGLVIFLVEILALMLVILVSILLVQGTRRLPVNFA